MFALKNKNRRSGRPTLISAFFVASAILHLLANLRDACPLRAVWQLTKLGEPSSRRYMHSNMTLCQMMLCRFASGVPRNGGNGISVSDLQRSGIQMIYIVSKFSCGPTRQAHLEAARCGLQYRFRRRGLNSAIKDCELLRGISPCRRNSRKPELP